MYIFIDESGQFTKNNGEKYFVVASFTVGDKNRTNKRFRSFYKTKFPKKIKNQTEIKFCKIKNNPKLKLKTIKYISDLDVRINYSYMLKKNIPDDYIKKGRLESGHLYTSIIGEVLEMYLPTNDKEFRVFCDERQLKKIKRSEFYKIIKNRLAPQLPAGTIIQIEMVDSASDTNIQIADWIVGAIASYLEDKEFGKEYFEMLNNNIIGEGKELFKDHWENKYNKN